MSSALIQCFILLASYLLAISEDEDEAEMALSFICLAQAYSFITLSQQFDEDGDEV
ncbi:hypothetical protein FRC09_013319, partial [Ceratobasidium sp. 395]